MKTKTLLLFFLFATITLQAQVSKTVECTAGGLAGLLTASEETSIINLTLTGTIDKRDFDFMNKGMPLLEVIDMIAVAIVAYGEIYYASEIPMSAFYSNNKLKSNNIPSSVTSIGSRAFSFCSGLTSVTIPSSVTTIHNSAFENCSGLLTVDETNPNYSSEDGILFNKNKSTLIQCPISKTGSYTINSSVTTIGSWAFSNCNLLTSITIPSSVTSIGSDAFYNCTALASVNMGPSVTAIGAQAFIRCIALTSMTIPSSVTSIGSDAFYQCSALTSVSIPSSVKSIGLGAFSGCKELTSLTFPSSVTLIEDYVIQNCTALKNFNIHPSVTSIGNYAFNGCRGLTSVTIPSSVTIIKGAAFYDCSSLSSIFSHSKTPIKISSDVFTNVNKTSCTLYVPEGSKALYMAAVNWKDFTNIVETIDTKIETQTTSNITIYPNLVVESFQLNGLIGPAEINIINTNGQVVLRQNVFENQNIAVGSLQKGAYFVKAQNNKGTTVIKFLKK